MWKLAPIEDSLEDSLENSLEDQLSDTFPTASSNPRSSLTVQILALVSTSFLIATDYSQSNVTCEICKHYAQVYDWLLNTTSLWSVNDHQCVLISKNFLAKIV